MKTALITGITGQDGAYLAELLLRKGYVVYGAHRRSSTLNLWRLTALGIDGHKNLHLVPYELTDQANAIHLVAKIKPDEIYNLAAQSFVGVSFDQPVATALSTGIGTVHLLEAIRIVNPSIRYYQASSSEMFGMAQQSPQNEQTPFYPRSPYGCAKLYAHWMTINYRESYGIYAASGILFNHESPLRGPEFVTRKITTAVAKIHRGHRELLMLGNLDAKRDWGFAGEYVDGMWRMLQQDRPDTYVLATGRTESIRTFATMAFKAAGIDLEYQGTGDNEIARNAATGEILIQIDPKFRRPAEVDHLIGNAEKARNELGWESKTTLESLCSAMVNADIARICKDDAGFIQYS